MSAGTMTELDLDTFLKELEEYDSAKCESKHTSYSGGEPYKNSECSIDAVARLTYSCGGRPLLWCQSRLDLHLSREAGTLCFNCKNPLDRCWTVRPV